MSVFDFIDAVEPDYWDKRAKELIEDAGIDKEEATDKSQIDEQANACDSCVYRSKCTLQDYNACQDSESMLHNMENENNGQDEIQ